MRETLGRAASLGWRAVSTVMLLAPTAFGRRLLQRRPLSQLSAFDLTVTVAVSSITGGP